MPLVVFSGWNTVANIRIKTVKEGHFWPTCPIRKGWRGACSPPRPLSGVPAVTSSFRILVTNCLLSWLSVLNWIMWRRVYHLPATSHCHSCSLVIFGSEGFCVLYRTQLFYKSNYTTLKHWNNFTKPIWAKVIIVMTHADPCVTWQFRISTKRSAVWMGRKLKSTWTNSSDTFNLTKNIQFTDFSYKSF